MPVALCLEEAAQGLIQRLPLLHLHLLNTEETKSLQVTSLPYLQKVSGLQFQGSSQQASTFHYLPNQAVVSDSAGGE